MQLSRSRNTSQSVSCERKPVRTRLAVLSTLAGSLLALCAGCAGSHPARSEVNGPGSQRPNPNAPYLVPAPSHQAVQTAAIPPQNVPQCDPRVLRIEQISGNSSGQTHAAKLAFINTGSAPCHLGGYPLVALPPRVKGASMLVARHATWAQVQSELTPSKPQTGIPGGAELTLMPHGVAAFEAAWTSGKDCPGVPRMLVTPPGTNRVFAVSQPTRICAGSIQVTDLRLDPSND